MKSHSIAQAGVQWRNLSSLQPPPPSLLKSWDYWREPLHLIHDSLKNQEDTDMEEAEQLWLWKLPAAGTESATVGSENTPQPLTPGADARETFP
ncbi:hypothetical protein AAY473_011363 [Plecturocebus cupreus]